MRFFQHTQLEGKKTPNPFYEKWLILNDDERYEYVKSGADDSIVMFPVGTEEERQEYKALQYICKRIQAEKEELEARAPFRVIEEKLDMIIKLLQESK